MQRLHARQGENDRPEAELYAPEQFHGRYIRYGLLQMALQTGKDRAVVLVEIFAQVALWLTVRLPGKAEEDGGSLGVLGMCAQRQAEHNTQHIFGGIGDAGGFHLVELGIQRQAKRCQKPFKNSLNQRFLGAEMVIHRRQIHPGLAGNGTQTGFREALLGKQYLCGIKNPVYCARLCHTLPCVFKTYVSNIRLADRRVKKESVLTDKSAQPVSVRLIGLSRIARTAPDARRRCLT